MRSDDTERTFVRGGDGMRNETTESVKTAIKQYYNDGKDIVSDEEVEEMIKSVESTGFLDKCREVMEKKEKGRIHIGRLSLNKVACFICIICSAVLLCGFVALSYYIKGIRLDNKGNHEVIKYDLDPNSNTGKLKKIETYYDPAWVPEGYHLEWAIKHDKDYDVLDSQTYLLFSCSYSDMTEEQYDYLDEIIQWQLSEFGWKDTFRSWADSAPSASRTPPYNR